MGGQRADSSCGAVPFAVGRLGARRDGRDVWQGVGGGRPAAQRVVGGRSWLGVGGERNATKAERAAVALARGAGAGAGVGAGAVAGTGAASCATALAPRLESPARRQTWASYFRAK